MTQSKNTEIKRVAVHKPEDLNKKQIKIKPEQIKYKEINFQINNINRIKKLLIKRCSIGLSFFIIGLFNLIDFNM